MSEPRTMAVAVGLSVVLIVSTGCKTGEGAARAATSSTATAPAAEETSQRSVPGPVVGTRITEAYARMVARDAYFWAWPMENIYNRKAGVYESSSAGDHE